MSRGFQLTALDRYLTKPLFLAQNLHDRETIAHAEAVDDYMANMFAYPGRTFGQLYHAFFRVNSLADGKVELREGTRSTWPTSGSRCCRWRATADVLAPKAAVHHVGELLPNAAEVRLETAPGGHLGVLTGRSAIGTTWQLPRRVPRRPRSGRPPRRGEPRASSPMRGHAALNIGLADWTIPS